MMYLDMHCWVATFQFSGVQTYQCVFGHFDANTKDHYQYQSVTIPLVTSDKRRGTNSNNFCQIKMFSKCYMRFGTDNRYLLFNYSQGPYKTKIKMECCSTKGKNVKFSFQIARIISHKATTETIIL